MAYISSIRAASYGERFANGKNRDFLSTGYKKLSNDRHDSTTPAAQDDRHDSTAPEVQDEPPVTNIEDAKEIPESGLKQSSKLLEFLGKLQSKFVSMDDQEKAKVLEKTDMHKSTFKTLLSEIDDRAMEMYGLDTSLLNEILGLDGSNDVIGNESESHIPAAQEVIDDEKDEIEVVEDEDAEGNHLLDMDDNLDPEDLDDYDEDEDEDDDEDDENEYELDDESEDDLPNDINQLRDSRLFYLQNNMYRKDNINQPDRRFYAQMYYNRQRRPTQQRLPNHRYQMQQNNGRPMRNPPRQMTNNHVMSEPMEDEENEESRDLPLQVAVQQHQRYNAPKRDYDHYFTTNDDEEDDEGQDINDSHYETMPIGEPEEPDQDFEFKQGSHGSYQQADQSGQGAFQQHQQRYNAPQRHYAPVDDEDDQEIQDSQDDMGPQYNQGNIPQRHQGAYAHQESEAYQPQRISKSKYKIVTPDEDSPLKYYDYGEQIVMNRPQPQAIRGSQYRRGGSYASQRHRGSQPKHVGPYQDPNMGSESKHNVPYQDMREFDADDDESNSHQLRNQYHKKKNPHMQYYSNEETSQDYEEDIEPLEDYEGNEDYDLEEDQSMSYNVLADLNLAAKEQMIARDQLVLAAEEQMEVAAQLQMAAHNQMMAEQQLVEREQMALLKQMQHYSAQNPPIQKHVHATNGTEGASTQDDHSSTHEESMEDMPEQPFELPFSSTADSACGTLLQFLQGQLQPRYMQHMSTVLQD